MTEKSVEMLVREKLDFYKLTDWQVEINNTKRTLGMCCHSSKTIKMSKAFFTHMKYEDIIDTILHEIAHALVGPGHGHGEVWKAMAVRLGCTPSATAKGKHLPSAIERGAKWVMVTPSGKVVKSWFRRPAKTTFAKLPFTWERDNKDATYGKLEIIPIDEYLGR
jgi:hypothetical protein